MKSLWITLILVATCTVSNNSLSFAQTPDQIYKKNDERIEKKEDVEANHRQEPNTPKHKNEIAIDRARLNRSTWKQPYLDRTVTALSRGRSPANTYLGQEDSTTHHLIKGETLILTQGTQPFLHNVLQFLKTAGITLITGGILTILIIYLLIMLIIYLRVFLSEKRVS
jgi:hypothetical protein